MFNTKRKALIYQLAKNNQKLVNLQNDYNTHKTYIADNLIHNRVLFLGSVLVPAFLFGWQLARSNDGFITKAMKVIKYGMFMGL